MTAQEAISNLRAAHEPVEFFLYLVAHAHEFRLGHGGRLVDLSDTKAFLMELAEAAMMPELKMSRENLEALRNALPMSGFSRLDKSTTAVPPQKRWKKSEVDLTCPRCGHVHEGDRECGAFIGAGRFCRCEMEMSA